MKITKCFYTLTVVFTMLMGTRGAAASQPIQHEFTHLVPIDIYRVNGIQLSTDDLLSEFQIAKDTYKACGFNLLLNNIYMVSNSKILDQGDQAFSKTPFSFTDLSFNTTVLKEEFNSKVLPETTVFDSPNDLLHWESLVFNGSQLTTWEKEFFINTDKNSNGVVYLDSLDWDVDGNNYSAIGYSKYKQLEVAENNPKVHTDYYQDYMVGKSIIGKYKLNKTMAHEIGHSVFNFEHSNNYNNIMINHKRRPGTKVTDLQCKTAQEYLGKKGRYDNSYSCRNYRVDDQEQVNDVITSVKICYKDNKAVDIIINDVFIEKEFILRSSHGSNFFDSKDFYIQMDDESDMAVIYLNKTENGYFLDEVL